jgi:lipopolysaccharide/colanic/teichoic acid biosynthesis glycosyltransferase
MKSYLNILYVGNEQQFLENLQKQESISIKVMNNNLLAENFLNNTRKLDAIICDFDLPDTNGMFLFDWVKKQNIYDEVPFILLDKKFNSEVFKLAFSKRVDDYFISTSVSPESLVKRIKFLRDLKRKTFYSPVKNGKKKGYKMPFSKRIFDVFVASSVLVVAAPFLLIVIIAIRLESKGKVYYTSKRVGRKTFNFYKLRSMRTGSDAMLKKLAKEKNQYNTASSSTTDSMNTQCPKCFKLAMGETCSPMMYVDKYHICDYWHNVQKNETSKNNSTFVKILDDPRVTKVGKFIRNTSIDELPQLINVLKGDMSIVGNRPLPVYEAEMLTADTLSKRFLAPAGITGLWQVELRGKGGSMSELERIELDNEYAHHFIDNNFSFWYDVKLILRTIPALLQKSAV